ncbi:MAG TPA: hypothetical protein VG102_00245 [Candidatus Paceibacterota bacterium]|jgi:hypothetical protein|nr:hypothetical protein [Candidatus Paceibacterota bacterium]
MSWTLVWAIVATVALGVSLIVNHGLWTRRLPFPDYGSFVLTCRDEKTWRVVIRALQLYGMRPVFRVDTAFVKRAIYQNGLIVNYAVPALLAELDNAGAAFMIPSSDPWEDAQRLKSFLRTNSSNAKAVVEPDMERKAVLVPSNAFVSGMLGFRLPFTKMGKPPKWHD